MTVSVRTGMLKTYELTSRHFGWERPPRAASASETLGHLLDRALRAQGIVSLDSICYGDRGLKPAMRRLIEARVRRKELVALELAGEHWARPEALEEKVDIGADRVHILSPFDPLVIQRRRLELFFGYLHRFEAYVPKAQRVFGYFSQPVLVGDAVVAVLDLKTDRERRKLLVQQWTWIGKGPRRAHKASIEEALNRFERFQVGT